MGYAIMSGDGAARFADDAILAGGVGYADADVVVFAGSAFAPDSDKRLILIDLGDECLADHVGEAGLPNVLGFARYRNGNDPASPLVELVRQEVHGDEVIVAARAFFEGLGLTVVVCADRVGRIVSRLVVPKYNSALRLLDDGLATQQDMDLTCKLGLGYPDGPIERVCRGGLEHHYARSKALFDVFPSQTNAPARQAIVARRRSLGRPQEYEA
jgi:3-hydroxybutyryl-CoA dehydrogenase